MSEFRGGSAPFGAAHRGCSGTTEDTKVIDREALERGIGLYDNALLCGGIPTDQSALLAVLAAARAHLATLPRVKPVEKWGVTYWSLTHKVTLCRVYDSEEEADHAIELNGSTARKHHLPSLEWMEPPT